MAEDQVQDEGRSTPVAGPQPMAALKPPAEPTGSPLLAWGARRLTVLAVSGLVAVVATSLGLRGGSHDSPIISTPSLPWSTAQPGQLPSGPLKTVAPVDGRTVLTAPAKFGWLPETVRTMEYRSMPDGVVVRAQTESGAESAMFDLTVFPDGVDPEQPRLASGGPVPREDAPQVNGREAYWFSEDGTPPRASVDRLRFRDADGRWTEVKATGLKGADRRQLPLQLAAGVVPGAFRVPLPVSMSALPPETEVAGVSLLRPVSGGSGSGGWMASLSFRNKAYGLVTIEVGPGERGSDPNGSAPGSSNDGLATVTTSQKCASGDGLHWCVRLIKVSSGDAAAADPADWLSLVVPHGKDESGWTTDVLPQS